MNVNPILQTEIILVNIILKVTFRMCVHYRKLSGSNNINTNFQSPLQAMLWM